MYSKVVYTIVSSNFRCIATFTIVDACMFLIHHNIKYCAVATLFHIAGGQDSGNINAMLCSLSMQFVVVHMLNLFNTTTTYS